MKKINVQRITQPSRIITREQSVLQELFGNPDGRIWGTGTCLPKINNALISGGGIIKCQDYGETSSLFGIFKRRRIV